MERERKRWMNESRGERGKVKRRECISFNIRKDKDAADEKNGDRPLKRRADKLIEIKNEGWLDTKQKSIVLSDK